MLPLSAYWSACVFDLTLKMLKRRGCGECRAEVCASPALGVQVFGAVHTTLPAPIPAVILSLFSFARLALFWAFSRCRWSFRFLILQGPQTFAPWPEGGLMT